MNTPHSKRNHAKNPLRNHSNKTSEFTYKIDEQPTEIIVNIFFNGKPEKYLLDAAPHVLSIAIDGPAKPGYYSNSPFSDGNLIEKNITLPTLVDPRTLSSQVDGSVLIVKLQKKSPIG